MELNGMESKKEWNLKIVFGCYKIKEWKRME